MDHVNIWKTVQDSGEEGLKKNSLDENSEASLNEIAGHSTDDLTYSPSVEDEPDHPISLPMLQRSLLQAIENLSGGDGGVTNSNTFETTDVDYQRLASYVASPDSSNDDSRRECEPNIREPERGDPEKEKTESEHPTNIAEDDLKRYLEEIRKFDFKFSEEKRTDAEKGENFGGGDLQSDREEVECKNGESVASGCAVYCRGAICDRNLDSSSDEEKPNEETEEEMSVVEPTYDAADKSESILGTDERGYKVKSLAPESDLLSFESDWISEDDLRSGEIPSEERVIKAVSEPVASENSSRAAFHENEKTISENKPSRVNSFVALTTEADDEKRETINVERRNSQSGGTVKIERPDLGEREDGPNYAFGEIIGGAEARPHPDFGESDRSAERKHLERETIEEKSETDDVRIAKREMEYAMENGARDNAEDKGNDEDAFSPRKSENVANEEEERSKESDEMRRESKVYKLRNDKRANDCGDSAIGSSLTEQQHYDQINYCKNLEMEANSIFEEISRLIENVREEFEKKGNFEGETNCGDKETEMRGISFDAAENETNSEETRKVIEDRKKNSKELPRKADGARNKILEGKEDLGEENGGIPYSLNTECGIVKPDNKETRGHLTSRNETELVLETENFCKEIVLECVENIKNSALEEKPRSVQGSEKVSEVNSSSGEGNKKENSLLINTGIESNRGNKEKNFCGIVMNENVEVERNEFATKNKEERNETGNKIESNEKNDSGPTLEVVNASSGDGGIEENGKIVADALVAKNSLDSENGSRFNTNRSEDTRENIFKKKPISGNLPFSRDFDKFDKIRKDARECCALERRESELNIFSKVNESDEAEKSREFPILRYDDSEKSKNEPIEFLGKEIETIDIEVNTRGNVLLFENVSLSIESLSAENYGDQIFEHEIEEVNYEGGSIFSGHVKKTVSKKEHEKRAIGSKAKLSQCPHIRKNSFRTFKDLQSFDYFDNPEEIDENGKCLEANEEKSDVTSDRKRNGSQESERTYGEKKEMDEMTGVRKAEGQTDITNGEKSCYKIRSLSSRKVEKGWTLGYDTKREKEIKSVQSETSWLGKVVNRGINRMNRGKNYGICASDEAISEYFGETSTLLKMRGCETITALHPSKERVNCEGSKPSDSCFMNETSNKRRRTLGNACRPSFGRENEAVATSTKMAAEEGRSDDVNQSRECRENATTENKTRRGTGRKAIGGGSEIKKNPGISRDTKNKEDTEKKKKGWKFGLRMKKFVFSAFGVQRRPAKKR